MIIELDKFILRPWRVGDEPSLVVYANNRKIWLNVRDVFPHPYTHRAAQAWVAQNRNIEPPTQFAIELGQEAVGGIGLKAQEDVHRRSAEIGYWLGEPFWGQGIVTEAVKAVTEYGFATFDICRIFANVYDWNPASMRVLEKAGYKCEGRLRKSVTRAGRTGDQLIYAMVR